MAEELIRTEEASNEDVTTFDAADVVRLAELVLALNNWIRGGGFLPARWQGVNKEDQL